MMNETESCWDEAADAQEEWEAAGASIERDRARLYGTVPAAVLRWAVEEADDDWVPGRAWGDQAVAS